MFKFYCVLFCGALVGMGAAQLNGQAAEVEHAPDYRAIERIAPLYFPPLPRAPFTATVHTLWVRALADGSTVTTENERMVARDSEGRVFEERRTFLPVPNPTNKQSRVYQTEYVDPVEKKIDRCSPDAHRCDVFPLSAPRDNRLPAGLQPDGTTYLVRENMGTDTFAGVEVERSKETFTLYKESIGNTNTILRTVEYWFSPALGINVQVKRHDPRDGDQTLWLADLSLSEAASTSFQVPADYFLTDHRMGSSEQGGREMGGAVDSLERRPPSKVILSAGVAQSMVIKRVPPDYPADAKAAGVQGTVVLQVMIGKDGSVESERIVSGPSMLGEAALNAVRQWTYRPYLLNGSAVEVESIVNVIFRLNQ